MASSLTNGIWIATPTSPKSLPISASLRLHRVGALSGSPVGSLAGFLGDSLAGLRLVVPASKARVTAWFKFGKRGLDAENAGIYGSQARDDFDRDDVEQYFNYMGMLATEGTYDKMEALLSKGIHPVDILLLLAASEGDKPKIEELMRAGAQYNVADVEGRTSLDRALNDEIRQFIISLAKSPV